jgi:hypothetical protein
VQLAARIQAENDALAAQKLGAEAASKLRKDEAELLQKRTEEWEALEQQRRGAVAQSLADLEQSLMTEQELEAQRHQDRLNTLDAALAEGYLVEEKYRSLREQAEIDSQARLGNVVAQGLQMRQRFVQQSTLQQVQTVLGGLLQMTQGVATQSRAMFEINKAAGIANAIINTYTGVTQALAAYPPPISFIMAAAQLAAGMAQVNQIRSAQFGSSSSAPTIAGGGAVPVTTAGSGAPPALPGTGPNVVGQAAAERQDVTIVLTKRARYTGEEIRELIEGFNEQIDLGARLRVHFNDG